MSFWDNHTHLFILSMFFFPRLTMLFATSYGGGVLYWLGWAFFPRLTVAIIASVLYARTDTFLVALTIVWAIYGEAMEKDQVTMRLPQ